MSKVEITVSADALTPSLIEAGARGTTGNSLEFTFSSEWNNLAKYIEFYAAQGEKVEVPYLDGEIAIPAVVMKYGAPGKIKVVGVRLAGNLVAEKREASGTLKITYATGENPRLIGRLIPSTLELYLDQAKAYIDENLEDALTAAEGFRDEAGDSAEEAEGYRKDAEAWAKGTRGGTPDPERASDNAKFYSQQADGHAIDAGRSMDLAAMWATGSTSGSPGEENNAKYYSGLADDARDVAVDAAGAAAGSAEAAEAWATGESGGTPSATNNAAYYAGEAGDAASSAMSDASDAEAYAAGTRGGVDVDSDDPAYENNTKYYAEQANSSAEAAAGSAESAEAWATGGSGGTASAGNNAKHWSEVSEAWATGGTGGTPGAENNAEYWSGVAEDAAESVSASAAQIAALKEAIGAPAYAAEYYGYVSSGAWVEGGIYKSLIIPVTPGQAVCVAANADNTSPIAMLKSFSSPPAAGDTIYFSDADGWTGAKMLDTDEVFTGTVPADAHYMYAYCGLSSGGFVNRIPVSIEIDGYDYRKTTAGNVGGKATENTAGGILNALDAAYTVRSDTTLWESGSYYASNGNLLGNTKRLRTGFLPSGVVCVTPANGYQILIYVWDKDGAYVGGWTGKKCVQSSSALKWYETTAYLGEIANVLPQENAPYQFKLVTRSNPEANLVVSDAANILFSYTTDKSLSGEWKAADAKTTGDMLFPIVNQLNTDEMLIKENFPDITTNGVTFSWNADKTVCTATGTATPVNAYCRLNRINALFKLLPGQTYKVNFATTDTNLKIAILYYDENSSYCGIKTFTKDATITIPTSVTYGGAAKTVTGTEVRLMVANGKSVTDAEASGISVTHAASDNQFVSTTVPFRIMQYNCGKFNMGESVPGLPPEIYDEKVKNYKAFFSSVKADIIGMEEYIANLNRGDGEETPIVNTTDELFKPLYRSTYSSAGWSLGCYSTYERTYGRTGSVTIYPDTADEYVKGYLLNRFMVNGRTVAVLVTALNSHAGQEACDKRKAELSALLPLIQDYDYAFVVLDMNNNGDEDIATAPINNSAIEGADLLEYVHTLTPEGEEWTWEFAMGTYHPFVQTYSDVNRVSSEDGHSVQRMAYSPCIDNIIYKNNGKVRFLDFTVCNDFVDDTWWVPFEPSGGFQPGDYRGTSYPQYRCIGSIMNLRGTRRGIGPLVAGEQATTPVIGILPEHARPVEEQTFYVYSEAPGDSTRKGKATAKAKTNGEVVLTNVPVDYPNTCDITLGTYLPQIPVRNTLRKLYSDHFPVYADFELL